jgi:hypothetical protein
LTGSDVLVTGVDEAAVAALMWDPSISCMIATMSEVLSAV